MAANYGIDQEAIAAALREFRSVKRRLEVKAEVHGITIIDDFAHHPTAIAQTLKAVRTRYDGRRIWAMLEPRSNTLRRAVFQHELAQSLAVADQVVLADVFKSEAIPEQRAARSRGGDRRPECQRKAGATAGYGATRLSKRSAPESARGRCGRDPFQRRLRRDLREAAGQAEIAA